MYKKQFPRFDNQKGNYGNQSAGFGNTKKKFGNWQCIKCGKGGENILHNFDYKQQSLKYYFIVIGGHTARYCFNTPLAEQPKRKSRALNDIQEA